MITPKSNLKKSQPIKKVSGKVVMILDDEVVMTELLSHVVRQAGFTPLTANNCKQAMEKIKEIAVDALLLDLALPDENGLTFLLEFKKFQPATPVVILTGSGYDESLVDVAYKNGASGYLSKTANIGEIMQTITRVMSSGE